MELRAVTVGEFLYALNVDIFPKNPTTDFEKKCREREDGLKYYLDLIGKMIHQHIERPDLPDNSLTYWKKEKIKSCITNLIHYTEELFGELEKSRIEDHCRRLGPLSLSPFLADLTLLMLNSYYGAVLTDIYWIKSLRMYDAMDIFQGRIEIAKLGKQTPNTINEIKDLLKSNHKKLVIYTKHFNTINEAFNCYKKKYSKAFNLLLLTSIEGLTRTLGEYLIKKQELNIDPFSRDYNSLDSFLRKIPWKPDLKIYRMRLAFLTSEYSRKNFSNNSTTLEQVEITLKTRLDFLRRRFKENRDLILHGQETEYDNPYHGFINASALKEVIEAIIEYHVRYEHSA